MTDPDAWSLPPPVPVGDVRCPRCRGPVEPAHDGTHVCPCGAREDGGLATDAALLTEARKVVEELREENAGLRQRAAFWKRFAKHFRGYRRELVTAIELADRFLWDRKDAVAAQLRAEDELERASARLRAERDAALLACQAFDDEAVELQGRVRRMLGYGPGRAEALCKA